MPGGIGFSLRGIAIGPRINQRSGLAQHEWLDLSRHYRPEGICNNLGLCINSRNLKLSQNVGYEV